MAKLIDSEKIKLLDDLLGMYQHEIEVIHAVGISWEQLKPEAKDVCTEDFDKSLIARETLLEELSELKNDGYNPEFYENAIHLIDKILLEQWIMVRDVYGLDVKAYFNVKTPKLLK